MASGLDFAMYPLSLSNRSSGALACLFVKMLLCVYLDMTAGAFVSTPCTSFALAAAGDENHIVDRGRLWKEIDEESFDERLDGEEETKGPLSRFT